MARPLTTEERAVLDLLLSRDFSGRPALLRQAETAQNGGSSCDCGCPSFWLVADKSLPPAEISEDRMVSDAHGTDPGGNPIGVLLFTRDGYLEDVEIFNYVDSTFAGLPRVESLRLNEWSEPNEHGTRWLLNDTLDIPEP